MNPRVGRLSFRARDAKGMHEGREDLASPRKPRQLRPSSIRRGRVAAGRRKVWARLACPAVWDGQWITPGTLKEAGRSTAAVQVAGGSAASHIARGVVGTCHMRARADVERTAGVVAGDVAAFSSGPRAQASLLARCGTSARAGTGADVLVVAGERGAARRRAAVGRTPATARAGAASTAGGSARAGRPRTSR
jgi:hypothetical protein